jgi:hypothetical protein
MSEAPVKLIPLVCMQCAQPIQAQPDEIAWVCDTCQKGQTLCADGTLQALSVFFSPQIRPGSRGRPFWVTPAQVTINIRETYRGNNAADSAAFWGSQRLFYIPAYQASLENVISTGMGLLKSPVYIQPPGAVMPFLPVTTGMEDIRPLAEFIVLAVEADRKDQLKEVKFDLRLRQPQLWVLPE